jgi:5-methylcytosine-specific restriction endonuclease McrA
VAVAGCLVRQEDEWASLRRSRRKRVMASAKLTIEMVPRGQWVSNLRTMLTRSQWELCKRYAREQSGGVCTLCGGAGRRYAVDCHEVWDYDESGPKRVQRLVGLVALCPPCHAVKHFGRTHARGFRREALEQLMAVNGWSEATARAHVEDAVKTWRDRSQHSWELDVSWLDRELLSRPDSGAQARREGPTPPRKVAVSRPTSSGLRRPVEDPGDGDFDNPFQPGSEVAEEHEMYMQMLADRD